MGIPFFVGLSVNTKNPIDSRKNGMGLIFLKQFKKAFLPDDFMISRTKRPMAVAIKIEFGDVWTESFTAEKLTVTSWFLTRMRDIFQGSLWGMAVASSKTPRSSKHKLLSKIQILLNKSLSKFTQYL